MDRVTKRYMSDNRVFADAVNFFFHQGEDRIDPNQLKELDPEQISLLWNKRSLRSIEKHRDVLKYLAGKQSENKILLLFGIENQTGIDYSMPIRNMLYDALQYQQQVDFRN